MGIHAISYYNESDPIEGLHELTEFDEFCSAFCMREQLEQLERERGFRGGPLDKPADEREFADGHGGVSYGAWPCGQEADYCVYCATCGEHLHCGISLEEPCPHAS